MKDMIENNRYIVIWIEIDDRNFSTLPKVSSDQGHMEHSEVSTTKFTVPVT